MALLRRYASRAKALVPLVLVGAAWYWWPALRAEVRAKGDPSPPAVSVSDRPRVELVCADPPVLGVPAWLFDTPRFRAAPVGVAPSPEPLRLHGTVVPDANRMPRVHSLFGGQVVKIGRKGDMAQSSRDLVATPDDGLRRGDEVKRGQILMVIWSKDAGAMKTDLVNQMTAVRAAQRVLERYKAVDPGVVPLNQVTQAQQQYESAVVMVRNAERNLRSAQFTEAEIAVVRREAEKLLAHADGPKPEPFLPDSELERTWAEYPIRAPFDGVIVEKNPTLGDAIDPTTDLFKLAMLDRMEVLLNVYEEDLPKLQGLLDAPPPVWSASSGHPRPADPRACTIHLPGSGEGAAAEGRIESLGTLIDPMQHTGTAHGWVDNARRKLFIGQFVTATVALPPDPNVVSVPASAVVEDADGPAVFVQTDRPREFVRRRVSASVRGREAVLVRKEPTPAEASRNGTRRGRCSGTRRGTSSGTTRRRRSSASSSSARGRTRSRPWPTPRRRWPS